MRAAEVVVNILVLQHKRRAWAKLAKNGETRSRDGTLDCVSAARHGSMTAAEQQNSRTAERQNGSSPERYAGQAAIAKCRLPMEVLLLQKQSRSLQNCIVIKTQEIHAQSQRIRTMSGHSHTLSVISNCFQKQVTVACDES